MSSPRVVVVVVVVSVLLSLLTPSVAYASSTYYVGSVERVYTDTGVLVEERVSIPAGGVTIQKSTDVVSGTTRVTHLYPDYLGSTVLTLDSAGTTERDITYYPYGSAYSPSVSSTDIKYTGQREDVSTDLYYYNARYYNPVTSHFISADTAEGPNRYSYVANNPIMRNDPTGHCAGWLCNLYNRADFSKTAFSHENVLADWEYIKSDDFKEVNKMTGQGLLYGLGYLYGFGPIVEMFDTFSTGLQDPGMALLAMAPGPMGIYDNLGKAADNALPVAHGGNMGSDHPIYGTFLDYGASANVYRKGDVATKIYRPPASDGWTKRAIRDDLDYQIKQLGQYGGGILPKLLGKVPGGYQMEYIDGVPIDEFTGTIPYTVMNRAVRELEELESRGFRHDDLNTGNILIQSENGVATRIRLIDPINPRLKPHTKEKNPATGSYLLGDRLFWSGLMEQQW